MTQMTNHFEDRVIQFFFRNNADTDSADANVYLALYSTAPTDSSAGVELSGNGYQRYAITFNDPAGTGTTTNSNTITFTASGGAWSAIAAHGICDAATVGNIMMYESVAGPTLADGDSYEFGAADITLTLD